MTWIATMLKFEGREYATIADVLERFPVSEKKIKKLIADGALPAPEEIEHGTRVFKHYPDAWIEALAKLVKPRKR